MTQLRQPLRLITGAILAFSLWNYLRWPEAYWIVISTLLGLQASKDYLLRRKSLFLLVVGLIAATTAGISNFLTPYIFLLAIFLFFTTFCTISVGLLWPLVWGGAFIANFYANLSSGFQTTLVGEAQRFASIILGFIIAMFLQLVFFPNRLRSDVQFMLADALNEMARLSEAIFTCFLAKDYAKNSFAYEQLLHARRRDYLAAIHRARLLLAKMQLSQQGQFKDVLDRMEHAYEIILSLGTLVYREGDHATFEVVYKEFLSISKNIFTDLHILRGRLLGKKSATITDALKENIYQLEDVYRSALNVVAKDPMVFLIVMQDLTTLNEVVTQLALDIGIAMGDKR